MPADYFLKAPANPGASADAIVYDSTDGLKNFGQKENDKGVKFNFKADQNVTVFYEDLAADGATWVPMNNGGSGDVIAANTPTLVTVEFLGKDSRVRLRTGTAPTVWHVSGRALQEQVP